MFIGMQFCGDNNSISMTTTNTDNINKIQIRNGIYDTLFGTTNVNIIHSKELMKWDFYTRFFAKFQNDLSAGNVHYSASTVSKIRIKRRRVNEHKWFTLFDLPIENNEDFNFELIDRYAQGNQEYYYALIPMSNNIEGNFNSNKIKSEFYTYYILDRDISYPIIMNTDLNLTINKESTAISTLGRKYPFYISNGISNYKSGSLKFGLAPLVNCQVDIGSGYEYRNNFEQWINNGKPKILKDWTGQIFMINIIESIPISFDNYDLPEYEINFIEIGNTLDQVDMYMNGFIDVNYMLILN